MKNHHKTNTILLLMLSISLFLIGGCQNKSQQDSTGVFRSPEGRFSIHIPGTPIESSHMTRTPKGNILYRSFELERPDTWYGVQYSDYPESYMQENTPEGILDRTRRACEMGLEAKFVGETEITLGEYPGRELTFKQSAGLIIVKTRIFVVGNRVYQITVRVPNRDAALKNAMEYLDSFKLLEE